MDHPRVIIVQTTPYSTNSSSRTLDSYFHYWERDRVRQIFSRNWKPQKGHCGELFQITDANLVKRWLHKTKETGRIYRYDELEEQGTSEVITDNAALTRGYKIGKSHTPTVELLRGILWKKNYWCTKQFTDWLDGYKPEVVFYNFTYNLFLAKIAIFIADRYDIPIITAIADDYYFNDSIHGLKALTPTYLALRKRYKKMVRELFARRGSAVFGCDKINDKYSDEFGIAGETIYYNSTVERRPFKPVDPTNPSIVYFGNIRLGRYKALLDVANALFEINPLIKFEIYSNETEEQYCQELKSHPSVLWGGAIPYDKVKRKIAESDIYVVAESFSDEDINFTRYSLSTKAADGLMSGMVVLGYGSSESGVISYLESTGAAVVCSQPDKLKSTIRNILKDQDLQRRLYEQSEQVAYENHTLESSTKKFEGVVERTLGI